jgi:hypothetical protein
MTRMLNQGRIWVIGLLLCVAADAQTPAPGDTNATPDQAGAPQILQTNAEALTNLPSYSTITNQSATETNLNYLLEIMPNQPPLVGPGAVGAGQIGNPLAGNGIFAIPHAVLAGAVPTGPGIHLWGPIDLHTSLNYVFADATSVETQPGQTENTIEQTISLGLIFGIGPQWSLAYMPAYSIYSGGGLQSTFSQNLVLRGGATYENWGFNLMQSYSSTFEPLIETGTQTSEDDYETAVGATYAIGSRLTLQMGAAQSIRDAAGFNDVDSWSGNLGLNFHANQALSAGISLGAGYDDVSTGSSMPFEVAQGTITFQPGPKLRLFVSGGAEDMQFVNPSAPNLVTPIYSASVQYQLFPATSISLSGSRTVNPAFFANEVQVSTIVSGAIRQVLSKKWALSLNAGYSSEPLTEIVPGPLPQFFLGARPNNFLAENETLNSTTVGVTLSYAFIERAALSAYYSFSDTTSSQAAYGYSSSQVGFSISYSY